MNEFIPCSPRCCTDDGRHKEDKKTRRSGLTVVVKRLARNFCVMNKKSISRWSDRLSQSFVSSWFPHQGRTTVCKHCHVDCVGSRSLAWGSDDSWLRRVGGRKHNKERLLTLSGYITPYQVLKLPTIIQLCDARSFRSQSNAHVDEFARPSRRQSRVFCSEDESAAISITRYRKRAWSARSVKRWAISSDDFALLN